MSDPLAALRSLSRVSLAHRPTPMEAAPRLAEAIGLEALWIKRDDCTGLALGGNKVRKLEFALAQALAADANCVVCGGVSQSNVARQVAAACAKLGLECHLGIMHGRLESPEPAYETGGNMLMNRLYGAVIHPIPWDEDRNRRLNAIMSDLRAAGRRPYLVPYGASNALGAMGYVLAAEEIVRQRPDVGWIVHASGSGGTQGGLLAALTALNHPARIIGVDADAQPERVSADVRRIGREATALLGCEERWRDERVEIAADWSAGGYGVCDEETEAAIRLAARTEGLLLDPVYTGKAMAALIAMARRGDFKAGGAVVWLHTGGAPGVFAYPQAMARAADLDDPTGG